MHEHIQAAYAKIHGHDSDKIQNTTTDYPLLSPLATIMKEQIKPTPAEAQARIEEIQQLYREWTLLLPQLQATQRDWQRGAEIMQKLAQFYFDGEYRQYHEALESGLNVNLHTQGEYSVMSEDALWNAFADQQTLAWQRLRSAIAVLDRDGEQPG